MKSRYGYQPVQSALKLILFLSVLLPSASGQASLADELSAQFVGAVTPGTKAGTTDSTTTAPQTTTLEGSVQKIKLDLDQLNSVGRDLKHLLKSLSNLYDEATYVPSTIISEPEMIGSTVIMLPIMSRPIGVPPQPIPQERVDLAMSEMKPVIDMLKRNVNRFIDGEVKIDLPDDTVAKIQPQLDEWVAAVNNLYSLEQALEALTQAPPYDNYKIADQLASMEKQIKKIDESRRTIFKTVRKEGEKLIHEERKKD